MNPLAVVLGSTGYIGGRLVPRLLEAGYEVRVLVRNTNKVLPLMVAPRWVRNKVQPIAIRDVLYYLVAAAGLPASLNRSFDVGGPDVPRYDEMMNGYAAEAGLRRRPVISLPVLTPWLASQWVNLVTPIPHHGRSGVDGGQRRSGGLALAALR